MISFNKFIIIILIVIFCHSLWMKSYSYYIYAIFILLMAIMDSNIILLLHFFQMLYTFSCSTKFGWCPSWISVTKQHLKCLSIPSLCWGIPDNSTIETKIIYLCKYVPIESYMHLFFGTGWWHLCYKFPKFQLENSWN